jgi:hypothetical protein
LVTPSNLERGYRHFGETYCPEDGGIPYIYNVWYSNIIVMNRLRRMRWEGHAARIREMRKVFIILS